MKHIKNYINEKLHVTSKSFYTCQPKTKEELQKIIIKRIEDEGPECDLNDIDVSKITDMSFLFNGENGYDLYNKIFNGFNGDISQWNVSNVKNMNYMFQWCMTFNGDISRWNVSKVTSMRCMFNRCEDFNCDLSKWNVSKVEDMNEMFFGCGRFNQNLDNWNVSNDTNTHNTFMWCPTKPKWYAKNKWDY